MGLWAGWPSWALVKRDAGSDTPGEWISRSDHSWAVASFDLANMLSAAPVGCMADHLGRKGSLLTLGGLLVFSFGVLYVPLGPYAVFTGRFLAGVCRSVVYVTLPGYIAEITSKHVRGRLTVTLSAFDALGMLVSMSVGPRISYATANAASVVLSAIYLLAIVRVPETPYYLLSKNRPEKARKALAWYRGRQDVHHELDRMTASVLEDMKEPATYHELFDDSGNRTALFLVVAACFAQRAGGISCIVAYSTTTLPENSLVRPENVAAVVAAVRLMFTLIAAPMIDKFGRRPLLINSHAALAVITLVYGSYLFADADGRDTGYNWIPSVCVVLFSVAYSMGSGVVVGTLIGEMFPANVKSKAVAVVAIVSSLGSFFTNKMYLPVADLFGVYYMYFLFTVINAVWATCAYIFLFETKNMTLSDIQDRLDEFNSDSSESTDRPKR
ncbi:facilitated trehalose transporter Tret1-like [Adelges cooleyi]|uniref:facilitated trehalose transporter Tret1-like n=1 Tax=Adelges cooleyi TaxID=133065 RepID=UPI00217F7FCB|nr:facilitated trehalose transporter Tret1-like [Adelges cooleyi]